MQASQGTRLIYDFVFKTMVVIMTNDNKGTHNMENLRMCHDESTSPLQHQDGIWGSVQFGNHHVKQFKQLTTLMKRVTLLCKGYQRSIQNRRALNLIVWHRRMAVMAEIAT